MHPAIRSYGVGVSDGVLIQDVWRYSTTLSQFTNSIKVFWCRSWPLYGH